MKLLHRLSLAIFLSGLLMALPAVAQDNSSQSANPNVDNPATPNTSANSKSSKTAATADEHFMKKAAEGGLAEVELGKLAADKASSDDVKMFGQRMADDHSKANDELKSIASQKGVTLPEKLNAKDQALKDRLEKLSGKQFDQVYMHNMVRDHTKDVAEFQHEASNGKDAAVKDFAEKTLPTLKDHLNQAKQIANSGTTTYNHPPSPLGLCSTGDLDTRPA